ncbi:MAG: prepilin-type N-terminal cleavage/methylation domain-containing protein [Verrucomicrobiota bacterium]
MNLIYSKKAFTVLEIMIVVSMIGLLATIAVPAFKHIRSKTTLTMMINDARQLSSGAEQYFLETGATEIQFSTAQDGTISGPMNVYVSKISSNYTAVSESITDGGLFFLSHTGYNDGNPVFFSDDGGISTID